MNRAELNIMKWDGMERNETKTIFHCLGILGRNATNFSFHCLESEWNGIDYDIFIPLLPFITITLN